MNKNTLHYLILICWFVLIFFMVNIINFSFSQPIFHSPDEAANYQTTKQYGTNSTMYFDGKDLVTDKWNNLHSRWFITYNTTIVPYSFLWTPLFYGTFYTYFWDNIRFINILFVFVIFIYLYKILRLFWFLSKRTYWYLFVWFLSCLPLVYYLNFPYYNILPLITFMIPFLYYIFKFNTTGNIKYFYLWFFLSIIVIWMRYEQILFILLFFLLNFIQNYALYMKQKYKLLHILILFMIMFFTFILPLLLLNTQLYGNPLTYWYSLFTKSYFAQERMWSLSASIINIFSPWAVFDLHILWINIKNNIFLLSPVFYLFALLSIFDKSLFRRIWLYWILIIYLLMYQIMSPTYWSGVDIVTIHNSINRYIIFIHIMFSLYFILYLSRYPNKHIKIIFSSLLIIFSINSLIKNINVQITNLDSLYTIKNTINSTNATYLLTPILDKITNLKAKPITRQNWWVIPDAYFNKTTKELSDTLIYLMKRWEKIYTVEDKNRFNLPYHFVKLIEHWVWFTNVTWNIYQLYISDEKK